ncbi:MAG: OmpA family protein [Candidatus Solibacter usitatus]|nr:OmpA family protein [Candidatus Solibacter usitatus]
MRRSWLPAVPAFLLFCTAAFPQGLTTGATKDDWEEINFETNSAILSDGYPSMMRLAELMRRNPTYTVKLTGHTDNVGSEKQNMQLAMRRAEAVKQFLEKYGVPGGQMTTAGSGSREPKTANTTPEGRFMNRRVQMTVTDANGKVIGDGSVGDVIRAIEAQPPPFALPGANPDLSKALEDCCGDTKRRLDSLGNLGSGIQQLSREHAALKDEMDKMRKDHAGLADKLAGIGKGGSGLSATDVARITEKSTTDALLKNRPRRFSVLGLNAGINQDQRLTFTGRARYFAPFYENFAFQAQGEYMYYRDRREGQFDMGFVDRMGPMQAGLFASFKNVQLKEFGGGGTLGQAAFTFDFIFDYGKLGFFGTKGFLDDPVVRSINLTRTIREEQYLRIVDQIGMAASVSLTRKLFMEGNLGYLKSRGTNNKLGGTARFIYPIAEKWALTLEGGMNETMLTKDNNGRIVAGIQWGNFLNPREFAKLTGPIPADVPRIRFEVLTRRIRTGNEPPVADAGPDQVGVPAGQRLLNGSASYDPEGDPITFEWLQTAGPAVALAGATTARATFTATDGQTYAFRLTVTDDKGASSTARVVITTAQALQARITKFAASPPAITAGQTAVLNWTIENADTAVIDGIGAVNARTGTVNVTPQATTTYRITAANRSNSVSETVTVAVTQLTPRIVFFTGTPLSITSGQASSLSWSTENADTITISGMGAVPPGGNATVRPTANTTYVLTAANRNGQSVTAQVAVTVNPPEVPRITRFSATPAEIGPGESSSLIWAVEGATSVNITGLGGVNLVGTSNVTPATTTTYRLTATSAGGSVTSDATVTVIPAVRILSFTANPPLSASPGSPVTLSWTTENATEVVLDNVGTVSVNGSATVNPSVDTTYTLRAIGKRSTTNAAVQVRVNLNTGQGPVANAGPPIVTLQRDVRLDGSRSYHPQGLIIGFSWRAVGRQPELLLGADTATPTVRFAANHFGEYIFELTVTDAAGRFSTSTTSVFFGAY